MREVQEPVREAQGVGGVGTQVASMILERRVVPRRWELGDEARPGAVIPFERWLALREQGAELAGVGVSFPHDQDAKRLVPHLAELPVIALAFPSWRDGRAYSQARKLRHLWGYRGVLLAHGDVLRDQLLYMSRVGFDAFHMRADQDLHASLRAFTLYSAYYQY